MPTAHAYWSAAADFAALAETMAAEARPVRDGLTDDVVVGGRLRATLDDAVEAIVNGLAATADAYDALAAECRRRAIACEEYTAALHHYHESLASFEAARPAERSELPIPRPPHREPWMTAG